MSFLKRLFGEKQSAPAKLPNPPPLPPVDPAKNPDLIRVFDGYGRELFITREQWRDSVLLGNIKDNWNNPDGLYQIIISALNDGFRSDVVQATEHLYHIDPVSVRGTCVWGIVLTQEGRLDEAENIFSGYIAKHGEEGVILTNLAKVHAARKDDAKAERILWRALELDPNQDNGMGWYEVIHHERGGKEAGLAALRRIAELPGSWRAQLWLARDALDRRDLPAAISLYQRALSRAEPAPADMLMQISGDLGNQGHLPELLELVGLRFDPGKHGLEVGNNLLKAHVDLGQLDGARQILDQLYALKRPDWKETLAFWDTQIAKARVSMVEPVSKEELKVSMLSIDGPIWLKTSSPAAELFPAKSAEATRIAFLGSSAQIATNSQRIEVQLSDTLGRLTRALPLFLAEQVEFGTDAHVQTLIPWIANASGGFVFSGVPWNDSDAAAYARRGPEKNDCIVVTYIRADIQSWKAKLRLVRSIDGSCLGELEAAITVEQPEQGVSDLALRLLDLLSRQADTARHSLSAFYQIPSGEHFPYYLLRLEQLLAVRCAGMASGSQTLSGEREILDGNLHQCLNFPASVSLRLLLAQTALGLKRVRPEVMEESRERFERLQRDHPLPAPAQGIVDRLLSEAV